MAHWPPDLRKQWDERAQRYPFDPTNPAESLLQTLRQAGSELEPQLAVLAAARADLRRSWAGVRASNPTGVSPAVCGDCGQADLMHSYTPKRPGSTLCEACFQRLVKGGAAPEAVTQREAAMTYEETRASERIEPELACRYVMQETVDQDRFVFHQGMGTVMNMSEGGVLLRLDIHPPTQQLIQVHLSHARTGRTLSLLQVLWNVSHEDRESYVAGCKFVFGPYSLSQDRLCALREFG